MLINVMLKKHVRICTQNVFTLPIYKLLAYRQQYIKGVLNSKF